MIEQTGSVKLLHFPEVNFVSKAAIATYCLCNISSQLANCEVVLLRMS